MARRRLFWQLFPSYIIVVVLAIVAVTIYIAGSMKKLYLKETSSELMARTVLFRDQINSMEIGSYPTLIDSLCKTVGKESETRFTVILPSGLVIGDTDDDPRKMENHANRPEIVEALSGRPGQSTRYSHTLSETMMYVAVPIYSHGHIAAVIRAALPVSALNHAFAKIYPKVIIAGLIFALLSGILSFYLIRRVSVPLEKMKKIAEAFSKGDFAHKIPPGTSAEVDGLANAMNQMASELDEKIGTIISHRNELDAILSSMVEGLLTFDTSERLISINYAASRMLSIDRNSSKGYYIQEIIRHTELQKLVTGILGDQKPFEGEIVIDGGRILQMQGARLQNDKGDNLGALVVLNDITRLRHLEKVRRDFVANVSHELRTPITSIKGFVETLQDGALNNPQDSARFLEIIAKQTTRLNSIVDDLLTLSQIEESEKGQLRLEEHGIRQILTDAAAACSLKSLARNIEINIDCDIKLKAKINPELLEQAIINLLDNAIKFSRESGRVLLSALIDGSEIKISVQDWGIGIEKKHFPRLFERFYTVDKTRSRELGGTGLGLSIVRHIVLAHNGDITLESVPDKGSTFTISLPLTS